MKQSFSEFALPRQEASLRAGDPRGGQLAGASPAALDELVHEIRQPLSTIESLAYYLELTISDERIRLHVERIQAMVAQTNRILERACAPPKALASNC